MARIRSIEKNKITIEWYNSDGALLGLHVQEDKIELFEPMTWRNSLNELIKIMTFQRILLAFFLSIITSAVYNSYITLLGNKDFIFKK